MLLAVPAKTEAELAIVRPLLAVPKHVGGSASVGKPRVGAFTRISWPNWLTVVYRPDVI